jgi:GNAT superfamily N-acetyltransferase
MSVQALSVPTGGPSIMIRRAKPEDATVCGRVCYEAFYKISTDHGFPPDFPSLDVAISVLSMMFSRPGFYCVVAESDGCMVGSNCLDERSGIAGLGPITVDPSIQNRGVGRQLLEAVLVRARERNFSGVRLLQSAFHLVAWALPGIGFFATGLLGMAEKTSALKSAEATRKNHRHPIPTVLKTRNPSRASNKSAEFSA